MHDQTIEDRIRSTLRSEADGLPVSVTAEDLERRLALRRRDRLNRHFGLLAAGIAAVAVTGVFALAVGPFRRPAVSNPLPSTLASSAPADPSASHEPTARVSNPLGSVREAVLVRPVGDDHSRPDAFGITLVDPGFGRPRHVATIAGSILPSDGWLDGGEDPPTVSLSGYLALPFSRGPNEDERHLAIAIVDVLRPSDDALILDGYTDPMWGPTEHLAATKEGSSQVEVFWIGSGSHESAGTDESVSVVAWSVEEGSRFVGTQGGAWGAIGFDGSFRETADLPAIYQRTGIERPTGVGAHSLGMGCDTGATGGGCILGEWADTNQPPIRVWYIEGEDGPRVELVDHAWASDGRRVLLLQRVDGEPQRARDVLPLSPGYKGTILVDEADGTRTMIGGVEGLPSWVRPTILGISAESTPGRPTTTAIGHDGRVFAFIVTAGSRDAAVVSVESMDGNDWFAGWADDPEPYDPD